MIHNITEEREKLHRHESSAFGPFDDEELARLIGEVEERALIHAPSHLKDNVFSQVSAERQKVKRRQIFSYRAKVLAGMAAALAVLFLVPADGEGTAGMPQTGILANLLQEETAGCDAWEEDAARRQEDIERTWERYQEGQRRADVTRQYFRGIAEKLQKSEKYL